MNRIELISLHQALTADTEVKISIIQAPAERVVGVRGEKIILSHSGEIHHSEIELSSLSVEFSGRYLISVRL